MGKIGLHSASLWKALLFLFAALYVSILLFSPRLGPTDDFIFLRTLQEGKPLLYYSANFPYYDTIRAGRLTPLVAAEYNLYHFFSSSPAPFWYYFSHAVQLVILVILFVRILKTVSEDPRIVYGLPILLTLLPGFTFTWFRLQLNERDLLFLLAIFILAYLSYLKEQKNIFAILSLLSAQGIIYYKETGFIIVGALAFVHLLLSWKTAHKKIKMLDALLLLGALVYVGAYAFYVLPYGGLLEHGKTATPLSVFIKNALNYTVVTDPFIMLLVIPLALSRWVRIVMKKIEPHAVFDAILFAATLFAASYFALNLHGPYYFLPLYAVIPLPLFYFLRGKEYRTFVWRGLFLTSCFLFAVNTIPSGIHYLSYYKYMPANFDKTMEFLAARTKETKKRTNIYFAGVHKGSGNWNYFIFSEFLRSKGLNASQFDLRAEKEDIKVNKEQPLPLSIPNIPLPYTVFESEDISPVAPGDFLVVSPQSIDSVKNNGNTRYLESLGDDYTLLLHTRSPFAFPMLTLKEAGRYLLSIGVAPEEKFLGVSRKTPNWEWPDYYVYVHK